MFVSVEMAASEESQVKVENLEYNEFCCIINDGSTSENEKKQQAYLQAKSLMTEGLFQIFVIANNGSKVCLFIYIIKIN